jgi:hypothetical protein
MRRKAGSAAAVPDPPPEYRPPQPRPNQSDLNDAWRLAFVVVADEELATKAVTKAFLAPSPTDTGAWSLRLDLLSATLRISMTRAADNPAQESESAVTRAMWQLPPAQRAALWLAKANELDTGALATILGITSPNAEHVTARAEEWLDVALDQDSGPLCSFEAELDDFIRGQLPADEAEELAAHLPKCPTCQTKERAFHELDDLKGVLNRAVPQAPARLSLGMLSGQDRSEPSSIPDTLQEPFRRIPAVRPLVACCIALFLIGLIGIRVVKPTRSSTDPPPTSSDPRVVVPGQSNGTVIGGAPVSPADLPGPTATIVVVTTTSVPAVTFPTLPPGRKKRS